MDRLRTRAPCLGIALAALGGALGIVSFWWTALFVAGALLVSPKSWTWWLGAVAVMWVVAHRDADAVKLIERVRGFSTDGYCESEVVGTLTVGRQIRQGRSERYGQLETQGEVIRVLLEEGEFPRAGEIFDVEGVLYLPAVPRNPGQFSERSFWKANGIAAGLRVDHVEEKGERLHYGPIRLAERLRNKMRRALTLGLDDKDPAKKIILAMVMGEAPSRSSDITEAFRHSGAMHVFAVSGLHVNLVATLCWFGFMVCGISRRQATGGVIVVMVLYALVTGFRPPAVRATLMTTFFLGAFLARRRPSLFNALALSLVLVVMCEPAQVRSVGFQLSYGVLAAIGIGFHFFYRWTRSLARSDPFMPKVLLGKLATVGLWVRRYLAAALGTSIPAWLGSLPITASQFGLVTPASVLASVLLIPLTFGVLALGLCSFLLGLFSPVLSQGVNVVNGKVARISYGVAGGFAAIPGGHFQLPRKVPADLVVFDTADGGAASYLAEEGGVMIDVGSEKAAHRLIRPALRDWRASVEYLVLTHPDGRHVGGAHFILSTYGSEEALVPVERARSPGYREFIEAAESGMCDVTMAAKGQKYFINQDVWFEVIRQGLTEDRVADDRGMVVKLNKNGWRVLFMGDAGFEVEEKLLDEDIACDLIVMGRHGDHGYSGTAPFLKATGARAIIISGGHFPEVERVPLRWRTMVEEMGISLFWQKQTGGVLVNLGEENLKIWSYLFPEKQVLLGR